MSESLLRALAALYRAVLALQPRAHRRRYREEMVQVFRRVCRDARRDRGWGGMTATAAAELWAAVRAVVSGWVGWWKGRIGRPRGGDERGGGVMGVRSVTSVWDDVSWAVRSLVRRPGHALTVVAVVGLGVGAFTTVFGVVEGVVFGPREAGRGGVLAEVWSRPEDPSRTVPGIRREALEAVREGEGGVFRVLEGFATGRSVLTDGETPASVYVVRTTPGLLAVLDVEVGRGLDLAASRAAGERRALLTHDLWTGRYASDPDVVGGTVDLRGEPFAVVGVLPPGVTFPDPDPAVWIPYGAGEEVVDATSPLFGIGWLRPGVTLEAADSALALRTEELRATGALADDRYLSAVDATFMGTPDPTRRALLVLLAAVAFTLLVAGVNAGVLVLTRTVDRRPELAVRTALGSGVGRVRRQLVAESLMLGLAGGVAGAGVAALGLGTLVPALPDQLRLVSMGRSLTFGSTDLAMAVALGVGVGLGVGLLNALGVRGRSSFTILRSGPGSTEGRSTGAVRAALVTAQIAFSFVLLAGAALLGHSVLRLRAVDPGMEAERLTVARLRLPRDADRSRQEAELEYRRIADRLGRIPGVQGVAVTTSPLPLAGARFRPTLSSDGGVEVEVEGMLPYHAVSPGYLGTSGIDLLAGRELAEGDPPAAAVVGEALARSLWPDGRAVGRRFRVNDDEWLTVVGVAEDVPQFSLRDQAEHKGEYYIAVGADRPSPYRTFVLRTSGDPRALVAPARLALRELHPDVPFDLIGPYRAMLLDSIAREQFFTLLLTLFAGLAVTLSVVGLYGLLSQHVRSRVREIGIRMTLGADRAVLLGGVLRRGAVLAGAGVLVGLFGAWALSRFLEGMLFEVEAADPLTLGVAAVVFGALAVGVCMVPGLRAVRVDPLEAVRSE